MSKKSKDSKNSATKEKVDKKNKENEKAKFSKIYENKEVREILLKFFEEECIDLLPELTDYVKDETLANRKNLKAPIVRKCLNLLHGYGLVEYMKIKDKRSGWYTYHWKMRPEKIIEFAINYIDKEINEMDQKINEIRTHNYICGCKRWTYKEALELDFICPECKKIITEEKGEEKIMELEAEKEILKKKKESLKIIK